MLDYFIYKKTPPGTVTCEGIENSQSELLGVSSFTLGQFEVKATGRTPSVSDRLLLPVKGSKQLSMVLLVEAVDPLITPLGSWSARCVGPSQPQFNIKFANINCDSCGADFELEFVDFSGDVHSDAIACMNKQGWQASHAQQTCPKCVINKKGLA